jgi:hypothetical protein
MRKLAPQQLDLFAHVAPVAAAGVKPKDPRLDEPLLLRELADTRREVRNLTVMGMRPELTADQREIIRLLERSARAQVKLGQQALNRGKPKDPRFDEPLLLRKLANTRREVRNLIVIGMRPDLPADKRELIHNAERSARAELKLRIKALWYCREQQRGSG